MSSCLLAAYASLREMDSSTANVQIDKGFQFSLMRWWSVSMHTAQGVIGRLFQHLMRVGHQPTKFSPVCYSWASARHHLVSTDLLDPFAFWSCHRDWLSTALPPALLAACCCPLSLPVAPVLVPILCPCSCLRQGTLPKCPCYR